MSLPISTNSAAAANDIQKPPQQSKPAQSHAADNTAVKENAVNDKVQLSPEAQSAAANGGAGAH
jgi:hypothetical protein